MTKFFAAVAAALSVPLLEAALGRVEGKLVISEPKTDRSRRSVPIARRWSRCCGSTGMTQEIEKQAAGDQWTDEELVFVTEFGTAVDPRNVLRNLEIADPKAGMTAVGVNTLRHSAAVAWLESACTSRPRLICSATRPSR